MNNSVILKPVKMKLNCKRQSPSDPLLSSHQAQSTENHATNHHLSLVGDSLDTYGSTKNTSKHKRKVCSSSQDGDNDLEKLPKRKLKSKKRRVDEEIDSHSLGTVENEMSGGDKDNTPESLRKKKKLKKKKNRVNPTNTQPNTSTLDYLRNWRSDRSNWKFEKVKQKRLISSMFDDEKLPDDCFSIFLEYIEGGSKSMKELITRLANCVVEEMEKWESLSDAEKETAPKINENKYKRARTVLQMLQ